MELHFFVFFLSPGEPLKSTVGLKLIHFVRKCRVIYESDFVCSATMNRFISLILPLFWLFMFIALFNSFLLAKAYL